MSVAELPGGFDRDRDSMANESSDWPSDCWSDQRSFMTLLVLALPELRGYARRLTGQAAEANDLVQETCRRAIESQCRFTAGSDMRAWLCRILRNLRCDALRRSSRETLVGDQDVQLAPTPADERPRWAMVSDDDLASALASLQPQYQRAYVMHAIEGRSYGAIAEALHVPCSTVGTRILRARLLLRDFLLKKIEARQAPPDAGRTAPPSPPCPVCAPHGAGEALIISRPPPRPAVEIRLRQFAPVR